MKLLNFKKTVIIMICIMLCIEAYACFDRTHRYKRSLKHKSVHRSKREPTQTYTLKTTNPWIRLVIGIFEVLMGKETSWMNCLLPQYFPGVEDVGKARFIQENVDRVYESLQFLYKGAVETLKLICKLLPIKDQVISLTLNLFIKQKRRRRRVFLEGKFVRKRSRTRDISNLTKMYGKWIFNGIQNVGSSIKRAVMDIYEKQVKPYMNTIVAHLNSYKELALSYYNSPQMKSTLKVMECVGSIKGASMTVLSVILVSLKKAAQIASGVGMLAILVDHLWSLLCNREIFEKFIGFVKNAAISKELQEKTYHWGKAIGTLFYVSSTAPASAHKKKFRKLK